MRTVQASEISTYVYCQRAWGYRMHGEASGNVEAMEAGWRGHRAYNRKVLISEWTRFLAYGLLLSSVLLFTVHLVNGLLG
jgi:hypothetical protein